jgi:two-component system KDP operon response regulator KdpE
MTERRPAGLGPPDPDSTGLGPPDFDPAGLGSGRGAGHTGPRGAGHAGPMDHAVFPAAGERLRLLVVDDDPAMVGAITAIVGTEGHQVVTAYDGETAIRRFREERPDVILLDLAMPGVDGYAVAGALRAEGAAVPIIVVSGERGEPAKVRALDIGADDYITKPFGRDELLARIRAAVRRASLPAASPSGASSADAPAGLALVVGGISIDSRRHTAKVGERRLDLTPTEYRLLETLARAAGEVVPHRRLLAAGWPAERDPDPLWLKPHLARLRRKLYEVGGPEIESVRAIGWRLAVES